MGKLSTKNLETYFIYKWRFAWAGLLLVMLTILAFIVGIDSSPSGLNAQEVEHVATIDSFRAILDQPINPITRFVQASGLKIFGLTELGVRVGTLAIAGASALFMFMLLKSLYWTRLALVGTLLMVTSSWFLHNSRVGTDGIAIVFAFTSITLSAYQAYKTKHIAWLIAAGVSLGFGLYTPLVFYLLIAAAIALYPEWLPYIKENPKKKISLLLGASTITALPLLYAVIQDRSIVRVLLNIPADLPSLQEYFVNIGDSFSYVFWRSFASPGYHLDQLPMLDVFTVAMVALGLFQFERAWPSPRSRVLFAGLIAALLTASINITDRTMLIFLPFIYVLAAIGVSTLLSQWQEIFPKNPIARTLGIVPISIVLLLTMSYHYNRYFVAWQQSSDTKAAFDQRLTKAYKNLTTSNYTSGGAVIVVAKNETGRFQYIQTIEEGFVRVVADEDFNPAANTARYVYFVSGARGIDEATAELGEPSYIEQSSVIDDGWLFQRFGE